MMDKSKIEQAHKILSFCTHWDKDTAEAIKIAVQVLSEYQELTDDNKELKTFLEASIKDTKFFENKLKELENPKGEYEDRLVEVVKGLELSRKISNKIANFIHYEIMSVKWKLQAQLEEMKKERDTLHKQRNACTAKYLELEQDRDRLKVALEKIANNATCSHCEADKIAKSALKVR